MPADLSKVTGVAHHGQTLETYKRATGLLEVLIPVMPTIAIQRRIHQFLDRIRTSSFAVLQYNHNKGDLVVWFW
jgi:hypothetical protein